jgi:phospholipase/carboxylesterase
MRWLLATLLLAGCATTAPPAAVGRQPLGLAQPDGLLLVPSRYDGSRDWPLLVFLHGARTRGAPIADFLQPLVEQAGVLVLLPEARTARWDLVDGEPGRDVAFIDRAMQLVFTRYRIDRSRVAIGGFSDGASYALSLGLGRGELFTHVVALSPGFYRDLGRRGQPRVFLAHAPDDRVLPIEETGRPLVRALERAGLSVTFREFQGGHVIESTVVEAAFAWLRRP